MLSLVVSAPKTLEPGRSKWAHGVVVSHPRRMRKALGSNPSVSIFNSRHVGGWHCLTRASTDGVPVWHARGLPRGASVTPHERAPSPPQHHPFLYRPCLARGWWLASRRASRGAAAGRTRHAAIERKNGGTERCPSAVPHGERVLHPDSLFLDALSPTPNACQARSQRASCGIRTHDLPLTVRVLCQLS